MPNSKKSLFQLKSFHYALWSPILIAILVTIYICFTSNLMFYAGFKGLNNVWEYFKVPLAIFSLVFPSVALVTANHRSIQSKKQIELTSTQNTLKNYYDSIDDFEKYLDSFTFKKLFVYKNKKILYREIFPLNTPKSVSTYVDKKTLQEIKLRYKISIEQIIQNIESRIYRQNNQIKAEDMILIISELYKKLKLNWLIDFGIEIDEKKFKGNDSVIHTINNLINEFYYLLNYCIEYSTTDSGLIILEKESFLSSKLWLEFQRKCDFNFSQINFQEINIPPRDYSGLL